MKKQVYFSFVIAALSFITVKRIQKAGVDHYQFIQSFFHKENGWFNFKKPDLSLNLPFELREISGVTNFNESSVACVQDENGIIFIYDFSSDSITEQFHFSENGDFEGVTRVDSVFYVLRSDATLFQVAKPWDSTSVKKGTFDLESWNHEGLCFDERNNRLLMAPKSRNGKGSEYKDVRSIYSIPLGSNELKPELLFNISVAEIESFAKQNNIELPLKVSPKSSDSISALKFFPSELAVHPKTDEIYIISAVDQTLAVYEKSGELVNFICLDPVIFNKPEGITFMKNGDLIITNEGQMGVPTLLRFNWNKADGESNLDQK